MGSDIYRATERPTTLIVDYLWSDLEIPMGSVTKAIIALQKDWNELHNLSNSLGRRCY